MSYMFVDSFLAVPSCSCSKVVYKHVWHIPLPRVQWVISWWRTEELPETCRISCQNKFVKLVHLFGFIIKKFVTMHGHTNLKFVLFLLPVAFITFAIQRTDGGQLCWLGATPVACSFGSDWRKYIYSAMNENWPKRRHKSGPSGAAAARCLGLRVRIPPGTWISAVNVVFCLCYVLIPRPEESYRVCVSVIECDQLQQ